MKILKVRKIEMGRNVARGEMLRGEKSHSRGNDCNMYVIATETVSQDLDSESTTTSLTIGESSIALPSNQHPNQGHSGNNSAPDNSSSTRTSGHVTNINNLILWSFNYALLYLISNQYHV